MSPCTPARHPLCTQHLTLTPHHSTSHPHTTPVHISPSHHTTPHLTLTPHHSTPHPTQLHFTSHMSPCTSAHHPLHTSHFTLTPHHSTPHPALHGSLPLLMVLEVHSCGNNLRQAVNSLVHLPGEEAVGLQTHRQTDKTWSGGS